MFFYGNFELDKFEIADFKYDNSYLKFYPKNTQIGHFWCQIQEISFLHEILQLNKFEGADFKHDNIAFKFQSKNTQKTFFVRIISGFLFLKQTLE